MVRGEAFARCEVEGCRICTRIEVLPRITFIVPGPWVTVRIVVPVTVERSDSSGGLLWACLFAGDLMSR